MKRIMSENMTTLSSLWNQNWKTVKVENEKKITKYLKHHRIKRTNLCRSEISQ